MGKKYQKYFVIFKEYGLQYNLWWNRKKFIIIMLNCQMAVSYSWCIALIERENELISHRLGYYPSPSYELYQNDPELYDVDYIYGDILNKSVLPVIIRADYNRDPEESELHHPYSHITLGGI